MPEDKLLQTLIVDLRRGTLVLAVLSSLKQPKYGYSLLQDMGSRGVCIESNTLYPLLRRLETQGLLQSNWDITDNRPRKYYNLSDRGQVLCEQLREEWRRMTQEMDNLLREAERG